MVNYMSSGGYCQANYCHLGRPGHRQNPFPESLFQISSWRPCFLLCYHQTKQVLEWLVVKFISIFHKNVVMILLQHTVKSVIFTVFEICKLLCKNITSAAAVDWKTVLCLTASPVKEQQSVCSQKALFSFLVKTKHFLIFWNIVKLMFQSFLWFVVEYQKCFYEKMNSCSFP